MRIALVLISATIISLPAQAQTTDPVTLLAQARQAAGGDAWDNVRTLHLHERSTAGGLTGPQDEWDDVRSGRYAVFSSRTPTTGASGFDGVSVWTQAPGGYSYVLGDDDPRQGAINQAYQTSRAYWYPERANATLASAAPQQENGRTYDVIDVTPQAGRCFSIWIDHQTHLIDRFIEQQAEDIQIVRLLDYHSVPGGIKLPFTIRTGDGDPRWDEVDTVQTAEVNVPLKPDRFALPPNPQPDFKFLSGKTSTTLPFRLDAGKLLIPVKINGHGPFDAELDSGGDYIVPPGLVKRLRLQVTGVVQEGGGGEGFTLGGKAIVNTLELGDIRLKKPCYDIMDFSKRDPARTLLGLQILQRFVVDIDFDSGTVTLTQPDKFVYAGSGVILPFRFQSDQPEIAGSVDGIAGEFAIDTGDDSSLLLIAPFVRHYSLVARYRASIPYGGHAVGGATHGVMTRAGTLDLFGPDGRPALEVRDPLTRLSLQNAGFDADRYVSGNVGVEILKQFNLIFDYSRQRIIFEKNKNYGAKEIYDRTGLQLKPNGSAWDVIAIVPKSPAADAGIQPGDQISTINGQTAAQLAHEDQRTLFRQPIGTKITLVLAPASSARTVTLQLRDIL